MQQQPAAAGMNPRLNPSSDPIPLRSCAIRSKYSGESPKKKKTIFKQTNFYAKLFLPRVCDGPEAGPKAGPRTR